MKTIIIKHLHLLNFKGVADLAIDFGAHTTDIAGRNGSGKTTVFDAFTWLLFGKDSQNRTEFDLKALDAAGKIIYHLPHEVSAIINVDGEDITLCRRLVEKWPKRNGEPTFTGNQIERLYNDIPCNEKEFCSKIAEICDEDTFKKITSPSFFVSQKADKQKADLMRMAGEINDADIAAGNPEFEMLMKRLGKKSIDELKREIGAKKNNVKAEIADIPGRIDERKRAIAGNTDDWTAIESEIAATTAKRDEIDALLTDINAAAKQVENERYDLAARIANCRIAISRRRQEIADEALIEVHEQERELKRIDAELTAERRAAELLKKHMKSDMDALANLNLHRERMLEEYRLLNTRIDAIKAESLEFDDADFICPVCHRHLEISDVVSKQDEMTAQFNADKQRRIAAITAERDANLESGKRVKTEITELTAHLDAMVEENNEIAARVKALQEERAAKDNIEEPDIEPLIAADEEIIRHTAELAELSKRESEPIPDATSTREDLKTARAELNARLDILKSRLAKRESVAEDNARIAELEAKYRALSDELNEHEHIEYIIAGFSKAKSEEIDARINGMFDTVRFRWIKYRVNGEETETCEATINGVPYASLNAAARIAAGIDIINAICRFEGVTAPIVIDNAESLNVIPKTLSQQIRLIVSDDEELTVKAYDSITA